MIRRSFLAALAALPAAFALKVPLLRRVIRPKRYRMGDIIHFGPGLILCDYSRPGVMTAGKGGIEVNGEWFAEGEEFSLDCRDSQTLSIIGAGQHSTILSVPVSNKWWWT